jgi:hypothetical protein
MGLKTNCKEVHRLTSEGLDRDLSVGERAQMRMHLLVCAGCRNFAGQMQLIRRAMRQLTASDPTDKDAKPK